jgi:hypothetical protein
VANGTIDLINRLGHPSSIKGEQYDHGFSDSQQKDNGAVGNSRYDFGSGGNLASRGLRVAR